MNITSNTVSALLGIIECQKAAISLRLPTPPGQSHLKRAQCEEEGDISHCVFKKRRVLAPPRRPLSMSTAAGVRAAVEARAIARMTSVAVPAATLVGATALYPLRPPPCPTVLTSAFATVQGTARPVEGRMIAMCRQRRKTRDVEMKDVSSALPSPPPTLRQSATVTAQAAAGPKFQLAPQSVLANRRIAVPRKRQNKKEDETEDMEVDG